MALTNFGTAMPYEDIDNWIVEEYGEGGVPGDAFYEVLDYYLEGSITSLPNSYFFGASHSQMIVTVRISPNIGHAVILISINENDDNIVVHDPQSGAMNPSPSNPLSWFTYTKSDIIHVYEAHNAN